VTVKPITLNQLIDNEPIDVEVPGVGPVKFKLPSKGDWVQARKKAKTHPNWNELSEAEKLNEENSRLVQQVLIDPKISDEDYWKVNREDYQAIVDVVYMVIMEYRMDLFDKRKKRISHFLELVKAKIPKTSTLSLKRQVTTGN